MLEGINYVAILGTTLFMLASAIVWYSPLLFGTPWLKILGVTEAEIDASRGNMTLYVVLSAIGYGVLTTVLAVAVGRYQYLEVTFFQAMLIMMTTCVAVVGNTTLWENRGWVYFLINAGFYAYFVSVGMILLKHWPW